MAAYSLDAVARSRAVDSALLVVPSEGADGAEAASLMAVGGAEISVTTVRGGRTRQESVRLGLRALPPDASIIVCHDAARPFADSALFDRVVTALLRSSGDVAGVIPVVPSVDTVKRVVDGRVVETLLRAEVALAQTPQAFDAAALRRAHDLAEGTGPYATDDAMLLEAAGYRIAVVEGDLANFKVTTLEDLRRAEALLGERPPRTR